MLKHKKNDDEKDVLDGHDGCRMQKCCEAWFVFFSLSLTRVGCPQIFKLPPNALQQYFSVAQYSISLLHSTVYLCSATPQINRVKKQQHFESEQTEELRKWPLHDFKASPSPCLARVDLHS